MNKRILFMGTPAFATASLEALVSAGFEVAAVVTAPDRPAGRGRKLRESDVKRRALELGIPVHQPEKLRDPGFIEVLDRYDAALYVVVAFRMLPEVVWSKPEFGTLNLHASLLPDYRGAAPINWALINGERKTGVTTFMIQADIDTGDLLLRREATIGANETAGELHDRLSAIGAELMVSTIKDIFDGTAEPVPQSSYPVSKLLLAPKLTTAMGRIHWDLSARRIHDLVRGLSPAPAAWTTWNEPGKPSRHLKILRSEPSQDTDRHTATGRLRVDGNRLWATCGVGSLELLELQSEGKRAMSAKDFINGTANIASVRLGDPAA